MFPAVFIHPCLYNNIGLILYNYYHHCIYTVVYLPLPRGHCHELLLGARRAYAVCPTDVICYNYFIYYSNLLYICYMHYACFIYLI